MRTATRPSRSSCWRSRAARRCTTPRSTRRALRLRRVSEFLQQLVNGITWGSVYALIALGYTMVYGILRLINFAHGDVFMLGAFIAYYAAGWFGVQAHPSALGALLVLVTAMTGAGIAGFVIERFAYRPVRRSSRLT